LAPPHRHIRRPWCRLRGGARDSRSVRKSSCLLHSRRRCRRPAGCTGSSGHDRVKCSRDAGRGCVKSVSADARVSGSRADATRDTRCRSRTARAAPSRRRSARRGPADTSNRPARRRRANARLRRARLARVRGRPMKTIAGGRSWVRPRERSPDRDRLGSPAASVEPHRASRRAVHGAAPTEADFSWISCLLHGSDLANAGIRRIGTHTRCEAPPSWRVRPAAAGGGVSRRSCIAHRSFGGDGRMTIWTPARGAGGRAGEDSSARLGAWPAAPTRWADRCGRRAARA